VRNVVVVAGCIAAALVSTAWASTKTLNDARGDAKRGVDIKSVTAKSASKTITWTITAYGSFSTRKAPCVGMTPNGGTHPRGTLYHVCGDGKIMNFKKGGTLAGKLTPKRPDQKTIVYVFPRRLLKGVTKLSWAVGSGDASCRPGDCDQAPEGPGKNVVQKL